MSKEPISRLCLWSGPRNISTALMYSFAQRNDTRVYDEPLYAHYLRNSNAGTYHPGAQEVLSSMENDGDKVINMMMGDFDKPVVFFKNMTHHLLNLDRTFMKEVHNILLTRDPVEMLPSYAKVIKNPTMEDVGYAAHMDLVTYLETRNIKPIVIDSKSILLDPQKALSNLCKRVNIPFDATMLHWQKGPRPEDGVWASHWYGNVHNSTGFSKYDPKPEPFPDHLKPLLEQCIPYYERLMELVE